MIEFGKDAMELHDIVAVWCAIENPPVASEAAGAIPTLQEGWKAVKRKFDVERSVFVVCLHSAMDAVYVGFTLKPP